LTFNGIVGIPNNRFEDILIHCAELVINVESTLVCFSEQAAWGRKEMEIL